jgi:hypothetical protein
MAASGPTWTGPPLFSALFLSEAAGASPLGVFHAYARNLVKAAARLWDGEYFRVVQTEDSDDLGVLQNYKYLCRALALPLVNFPGLGLMGEDPSVVSANPRGVLGNQPPRRRNRVLGNQPRNRWLHPLPLLGNQRGRRMCHSLRQSLRR